MTDAALANLEYKERVKKAVAGMREITVKNPDDRFRKITELFLVPAYKDNKVFYVDLFNAAFDLVYG